MDKNRALIQVSDVSRQFQAGSGSIEALKNVSFDIAEGSFTVIYGPSGSGKSTLLHILMGLDAPSSGRVLYEGQDLYTMNPNQRAYFRAQTMGIVRQTNHWVRSLTVVENVALPLQFTGSNRADALAAAYAALERVGMQAFADKLPSVLSGGEQQRVSMARSLSNNPWYIVADEPTGNLDSKNGDDIIKLLYKLNKSMGRTVIMVTHNIEYLAVADQILITEDGVVTETKDAAARQIVGKLFKGTKERIDEWGKL